MTRKDRLERVTLLSSQLLDGVISEAERAELNELLRGDPETCERYLDLAESHALLLRDHAGDLLPLEATGILPFSVDGDTDPVKKRGDSRLWGPVFAAAAVLALLANGYQLVKESGPPPVEPSHVPGVAVLSRLVAAEWSEPENPPREGETVPAGAFRLKSGLAQLEFFSGATLIVEGPAELLLKTEWKIHCESGKLRAFVPEPARGFVIETADYRAVDLGTEFALSVGRDGESEVHVVEGEVRLDNREGREIQTLFGGDGMRASRGGFERVHGGGGDFVDRRELLHLANVGSVERYRQWLVTRNAIARDPATLVLFDFENQDPWDRQLVNQRPAGPEGAIIGAQWTEGRWPGKGALEFKRITDRTRVQVPGTFDRLSLAAWVRIEGFDRWLSSLFLTDGFETGEVHWQISNQGELILGISGEGPPNTLSDPVIHPDDLGKWIHLAVTIDRLSGIVRHYRDGTIVKEETRSGIAPLKIGKAEIGNWQAEGSNHAIRSLNGRIDEFFILSRVVSPEEMASIYRAGLPNG
jgi:hypothetical protein